MMPFVCPPTQRQQTKSFKKVKDANYILTDEGPPSAFLGLKVERLSPNVIELSQPVFIDRIIESVGLKDKREHQIPANIILCQDKNGEQRKTEFHYRSVVGQLNYLATTMRPEIQFAVHQCAQFSQDPSCCMKRPLNRLFNI